MNETLTPLSKVTALALALAVVLLMLLALFLLRDHLRTEMHDTARAQTSAQEKLAARLDTLTRSVDALAAAAQPSSESQAALEAKLAELTSVMQTINTRLEAIEKKPVAAAPEPLPPVAPPLVAPPTAAVIITPPVTSFTELALVALSGKPYVTQLEAWEKATAPDVKTSAALRAFAPSGIPSDAEIIRQLRAALDAPLRESVGVDDVSMVGKINTHLAGLVSIKKSGTHKNDAYSAVRAALDTADMASLITTVERLDEPARAPLAAWLATAKARAEAMAILTAVRPESYP